MGATRERGLDASRTIPTQGKIKMSGLGCTGKGLSSSSKGEEMVFCKNVVKFLWNTGCVQVLRVLGLPKVLMSP